MFLEILLWLLVFVLLFFFVIPYVIYVWIKVGTFAYFRGRDLFFKEGREENERRTNEKGRE